VKAALPQTVVIGEGRVGTPALAEELLADGVCDLVGMNRALIADPELPRKAGEGRVGEIRPCIYCNQSCLGRRMRQFSISCVQNPATGFEGRYGRRRLTRVPVAKRVVVVGGGPSGLEAARVAAERGHEVILIEARHELGGQARLAARLPHHAEFLGVVDYRERELARLGVRVETGRPAGPDDVARFAPDVVLVATGSRPDRSGFQPALGAGVDVAEEAKERVIAAADVVAGASVPAGDVVLLDGEGHRKSLGTAELLAASGRVVTVVSADALVGSELEWAAARTGYLERLADLGARLRAGTVVVRYDGERVLVRSLYDGCEDEVAAAALVLATPHVAEDSLLESLEREGIEAIAIGDARAPRLLDAAVNDGFRVAFDL
jgi:NADPH-dependent 2,4-dienoyl-CoA reductase/sulfur reductase-like enzyme